MSRARITIEHWDAVPAWKKQGTEGMFNVVIETPMFDGETRKDTRSFTYGECGDHKTALEAAESASVYLDGAAQMYHALGFGGLKFEGSRLHALHLARRIDVEAEVKI